MTAPWSVLEGDCLPLLRAMPPKSGVIVADPPYAVGKAIAGDRMPWEQWLPWLDERIVECRRVGRLVFMFFAATRLIRFIRETTQPPDYEISWHKPMILHDTSLSAPDAAALDAGCARRRSAQSASGGMCNSAAHNTLTPSWRATSAPLPRAAA